MNGPSAYSATREHAPAAPPRLAITVQPSRIKVTDARPSLSYRIYLDALGNAPHWVEIALADHPDLFDASARGQRSPETFFSTRALGRLPARRGETLFVVPPWALQRLAGASRLYHAVAVYADAEDGTSVSVNAPGDAAVYVDLSGFTGTSLGRLFGTPNPRGGLIRYPKPESEAASSELSLLWAGDMPRPGTEPGPEANAQSAPTQLMGNRTMQRHQNGILHQSAYRNGNVAAPPGTAAAPAAPHPNGNGNGNGAPSGNGNGQHAGNGHHNGNGAYHPNGNGAHHSNGNGMPAPQMPSNGNGNGQHQPQAAYRPEDYDDGHGPMAEQQGLMDWLTSTSIGEFISEIGRYMQAARERHEGFVVGVPNTSFFPFSAICRISGPQGSGTGFYIAPDKILTAAHVLQNQGTVTVTAGQNGHGDPGLAQFSVSSGDWSLHPSYDGSDSFDLAVMRVSTPPPNGLFFDVINYSPAADTPLAICGYGATCDTLSLNSEIQHLDIGRLGPVHLDLEGMDVSVLACHGTSGSPAFVEGPMMSGDHDTSLIPVMGILVSGPTDIDNNICMLTPDKIDWAMSGGTLAVSQGYTQVHQGRGAPARHPMSQPMCPEPQMRNGNSHPPQASGHAIAPRHQHLPVRQLSGTSDTISAFSLGDVIAEITERLRQAQQRMESWIVGVPDTSFFPFSSICHLEMNFGGNTYFGTGFYITHDRILTVGHNLWDLSSGSGPDSVRVRVGRNGSSNQGDFVVTRGQWDVHPNYVSGGGGADFDLGLIYAPQQPPGPNWFELINFSPAADTTTAICGHGMRNFNNQEVLDHTKQHLDVGRIGELLPGGEAMRMDILAMRGHSGSPCFVEGGMTSGGNLPGDMPVMGVLSQIDPEHDGYICLLTPDKIQWAIGQSLPEYSGGMSLGHGQNGNGHRHGQPGQPRMAPGRSRAMTGGHQHAQAQTAPPVWVPIVTAVGSAAASAGITALANSSGDVTWSVQSMNGWMRPGEHPTPTVPIEPAQIATQEVDLASPIYDAVMGDVFAHFRLRFGYDGSGLGQIITDPAPYAISDPWGKGLKVRMIIEPMMGTYHAQGNPSQQVAAVQVTLHYEYEHTFADSTFVQYIYTLYGDGTYESRIDSRAGPLSEIDIDYAPGHPYRR